MKMNKKMLSLLVAGLLSVPFAVGCSDNEVEQQLPQTQIEEQPQEQQKPIDEDLNDEYKAKIDERQQISDLDQAEQYIDQIMAEHFQGVEYMIMKNENGLAIVINIPDNDIAFTSIEEWNELVGIMVDYDIMIQQFLQECGLNVPTATMVADIESDIPLLAIVNGEVMYDIFNGIDRLN